MADSPPRLFTIAPGQPFLAVLADALFDETRRQAWLGDSPLADVQILLPTRRAARELAAVFMRLSAAAGRPALVLPRIETLGDADEDIALFAPDAAADRLDLPPAIAPLARHFHLLPLIRRWAELTGQMAEGRLNPVKISALAFDLENFLDQAQNEQIDWARLPELVPEELAENWQQTLGFLDIITQSWPAHLEESGCLDPTARRNLLLAQRTQGWAERRPAHPVIAAGTTGSIRATADLLAVIARLPRGAVVLPGLDLEAADSVWQAITKDAAHPQHGMAQLLQHIEATRADVQPLPGSAAAAPRTQLLNRALVPAAATADWATTPLPAGAADPTAGGCHIIEAADARAEAGAVALIMREVLETPDKTAALVTRDRNLARRVAGELMRWNIAVDDSAGQPLSNSLRGRLMRLILACRAEHFAPVPLLALLKHRLVCLAADRPAHVRQLRQLDRLLRGPRRPGGLAGLHAALAEESEAGRFSADEAAAVTALLQAAAEAFAPYDGLGQTAGLAQHVAVLEQVAGRLMADPDALHAEEDGRALAALAEQLTAQDGLAGPVAAADWPALFDLWLARHNLRRQTPTEARLAIWGPLEARLMQADVMILGGLNETVWPPMPETGPWLSRPMRAALGLSQPERQIGLAAHDFVQGAAAPTVYLTRALKADGAPTVAARWLRRLETLGGKLPRHEQQRLLGWWHSLDAADTAVPETAPAPCPPVALRPDRLSVTQIETLLHNPYQIYALKILGLRPWEAVDAPASAGHRGTLLHGLMEAWVAEGGHRSADPAAALSALAEAAQADRPGGAAVLQHWQARLQALGAWLAAHETARADMVKESHVELSGRLQIDVDGTPFTVTAKADRLDVLQDGRVTLIDYKTGALPSRKDVERHLAPQLTLEAAILAAGGFAADGKTEG